MRKLLSLQFVRFLLVGVVNTGFSYGVYALLLYAGMGFIAANLLATVIGIGFSFRTQGRLVFGNRDPRRIVRFAAWWLVLWGFNIGLIALLVRAGTGPYLAGALALVPVTLVSYFGQRLLVFRTPHRAG